jgi:hypothetical protein
MGQGKSPMLHEKPTQSKSICRKCHSSVVLLLLFSGMLYFGPAHPQSKSATLLTASNPTPPLRPVSPVKTPSLHLLGERHSGTKWMTEHLTECFGQDIHVRKSFSAWKHWFQIENPRVENAVVVAQFRNPYYWLEAMHRFPHHAPEHFDLDWKTFFNKPWTMRRYGEDVEFDGITAKISDGSPCSTSSGLGPHEVIPCMANWTIVQDLGHGESRIVDAFYELRHDGSGRPYSSLLELRRDKIYNFMSIADFSMVQNMYAVQYDDMVEEGTDKLLRQLESALGVKAKCEPYPGKPLPKKELSEEFKEYARTHVDWAAEAMLGYGPGDL